MAKTDLGASNLLMSRLLLWVPAGIGGLLALLVLAVGSMPLLSQLQLQGRQVEEKRAQEMQLPQLRADLLRLSTQQQTAERQQQQLISLIAGSGELVTFMALADREARRHGVQLELYEPTASLSGANGDDADPLKPQDKGTRDKRSKQADADKQAQSVAKKDPLKQAGLSSQNLLLSAKGRYPNLLAFMRAMESLSLLVVQSNLNLNQPVSTPASGGSAQAKQAPLIAPIELKLAIALYNAKT